MVAALADYGSDPLDHFQSWVVDNRISLEDGELWVPEAFQIEIVGDMLAGFREMWVIIPEGNAKTTLFAIMALHHADHVRSPWVPIGAASRDQAEIMFGQAAGVVERSKVLQNRFRVYEGYRKIKCHTGGRGIKVYAADAGTGDGVIPTLALIDEPHRHKDMSLYRLWKGKLGKRGGQIAAASTAGEPDSDFENMREMIRNMADERVYDGAHLRAVGANIVYHEWMVESAAAAADLEKVKAANPLAHVSLEYLREKSESPTLDFGTDWLRLTCNIPTRSSAAAIPEKDWDGMQVADEIPVGVRVSVGADFAWLEDTTAFVPYWDRDSGYRLMGEPTILEPPRDGTMLDVQDVKTALLEINERNPIAMIVADRHRAEDVLQWAEQEFGCVVVDRSQKNEMQADDYERFVKGIREGWLHHTGDRGFRRHALSAIRIRLLGDKYRFDRPRTRRKSKDHSHIVIDALTAAAMVNSVVTDNPGAGGVSVLDDDAFQAALT